MAIKKAPAVVNPEITGFDKKVVTIPPILNKEKNFRKNGGKFIIPKNGISIK